MTIRKPRVLIPITVQFSIRYVVRTGILQNILQYAQPIIALAWTDPVLKQELIQLGAEVVEAPGKKLGVKYLRILNMLTQHHLRQINTPTTKIDQRRNKLLTPVFWRLRNGCRNRIFQVATSISPILEYLKKQQDALIWSDTNLGEYVELVKRIRPDMVFCLTPYFIEEELLLRACQYSNLPISTAILSFDNLTTRGYIPIKFSEYFLWNKYNVSELHRIYPDTLETPVKIVGAPQFDFYYRPDYLWSEDSWRKRLGLPKDRPVLLFGSASKIIAPQEEIWIRDLDQAICQGKIIGHPVILLRRHPNERMDRWEKIKNTSANIYFDEPWKPGVKVPGKTDVTRDDIEKLVSTLSHSAIHINASSTMTVDGAVFDRPQIGPAYAESRKFHNAAYEIYLREHYLPITNSGGLEIVRSREEFIRAINTAFENPGRLAEGRKKLVQEIITYTDGKCSERVSGALRDFVERNYRDN